MGEKWGIRRLQRGRRPLLIYRSRALSRPPLVGGHLANLLEWRESNWRTGYRHRNGGEISINHILIQRFSRPKAILERLEYRSRMLGSREPAILYKHFNGLWLDRTTNHHSASNVLHRRSNKLSTKYSIKNNNK